MSGVRGFGRELGGALGVRITDRVALFNTGQRLMIKQPWTIDSQLTSIILGASSVARISSSSVSGRGG